jgi:lipoyl(octanoyl) transferase
MYAAQNRCAISHGNIAQRDLDKACLVSTTRISTTLKLLRCTFVLIFLPLQQMEKQRVIFEDLGRMPYQTAWDYQETLRQRLISHKLAMRQTAEVARFSPTHYLLFVEHPHVFTLGSSGSVEHILLTEPERIERNIEYFKIRRGGDITYHGLGQIVGYPIFDLEYFFTDVRRYMQALAEAVRRTIAEYGLEGAYSNDNPGVWLPPKTNPQHEWESKYRKICAVGVHLSRWVTLHGFAFNVNTDLAFFDYIVPCGIVDEDKTVTSMARELGHEVNYAQVQQQLKKHFADIFDYEYK